MVPFLRLVFWTAAILFAAAPLVFGIVARPENFGKLFQGTSYLPFTRDLIFLAIAILAIGLIDSLEAMLALRNPETPLLRVAFTFTLLLLVSIIVQLCLYVSWSGHIEQQTSSEAIAATFYVVLIAGTSALFARAILVASPLG
jgi:hypothetical protein